MPNPNKTPHPKGFGIQWTTYLPPSLDEFLKKNWRKIVPGASPQTWKALAGRMALLKLAAEFGYVQPESEERPVRGRPRKFQF